MNLPKYSIGVGDRFAHQGAAQLGALQQALREGVAITPVWNKSHREHTIVGSRPADVRLEADRAVKTCDWTGPYFVDADHISLGTVDAFLESSDFFTLDVADWIGTAAPPEAMEQFIARHEGLIGRLSIRGMDRPLQITRAMMAETAGKFLAAVAEAGRIWRHIAEAKGTRPVVIEVSLDETDRPQTPAELLLILAAVADQQIPAETIAPRFCGRFNKGVEYVGDPAAFGRQFEEDLAVLAFAIEQFSLPENLKLSVHSGSDKFALYGAMHAALKKFDAGVHLKTAGTTWLEELIGLAAAGGDGLAIAKEVYRGAWSRFEELCAPYASVVDIDRTRLPRPETVAQWDGSAFAAALRHDTACPQYNPHLRQLLHVGYKVAAEMGDRFLGALDRHAEVIAANVRENLYQRHIQPLFLGRWSKDAT
jgi:tagaturonate epimerase